MRRKSIVSLGLAAAMVVTLAVPGGNVEAAAKQAKKITFTKKKLTVKVGQKKKLKSKLKVTPKAAKKKALKNVTWKSSNKKVVKVNKKGVITGKKAGKATVTAKLKVGKKTLKAKCKITVTAPAVTTPTTPTTPSMPQTPQVKVTEVKADKSNLTLNERENAQPAITVLPSNASNKTIQYTSSDENVAVVDEKGVITAIAQGTTVITAAATDGSGKKAEITVTVTKKNRPRTIITQDAEVDDMDSLIHILLYSNEIDIQGIVQSSSQHHWIGVDGKETPEGPTAGIMKSSTGHKFSEKKRWPGTDWMFEYLDAYEEVYSNLKKHDSSYPTPDYLRSVTKIGNIGYEGEMDAPTEGSELIRKAILDDDERTLYLQAWGGINTIARALKDIEEEYKGTDQWDAIYEKVVNKVVISACGEQDYTYEYYIQDVYPDLKFMNSNQMGAYAYMWGARPDDASKATLKADYMLKNLEKGHGALLDLYVTWGDGTYLEGEGDSDQFGCNEDLLDSTNWWGRRAYQRYDFLSEGDSPTFFMLFDTGLRSLESSTYGGWSGRLEKTTTRTNKDGVLVNYWSPVEDTYIRDGGTPQENDPATILSSWKYVDDIQNDFSARADWCITDNYDDANHAPALSVEDGVDVTAAAGEKLKLKAIASDPDGDYVTVNWTHYADADTYDGDTGLTLKGAASDMVSFTVPEDAESGDTIHLIVQAKDDGEHTLTHYQQVIITVE